MNKNEKIDIETKDLILKIKKELTSKKEEKSFKM